MCWPLAVDYMCLMRWPLVVCYICLMYWPLAVLHLMRWPQAVCFMCLMRWPLAVLHLSDALAPGCGLHVSDVLAPGCVLCLSDALAPGCVLCLSDVLASGCVLHLSDVLAPGCYICLMRWTLAVCRWSKCCGWSDCGRPCLRTCAWTSPNLSCPPSTLTTRGPMGMAQGRMGLGLVLAPCTEAVVAPWAPCLHHHLVPSPLAGGEGF